MAQSHKLIARNTLANALAALVNQGSLNPTGRLVVYDSGNVVVARHNFANPAFQAAVDGVIDAYPLSGDANPVIGAVPYRYEVQDRDQNVLWEGHIPEDMGGTGGAIPSQGTLYIDFFAWRAPS